MEKPDSNRDVLGYDEAYGWVICMWTETFGWYTGWECFVGLKLPNFSPTKWVELPEECGGICE